MMSADKPDSSVPHANHFMIGRSSASKKARMTSNDSIPKYLPDGNRRKAADVASELNMRLLPTDMTGDCFIDAFAYYEIKLRDAVTWKQLRCELSDYMEVIACQIEKSGGRSAWAACFKLCGEDEHLRELHTGPTGICPFHDSGPHLPSAVIEGTPSSSSGTKPIIGHARTHHHILLAPSRSTPELGRLMGHHQVLLVPRRS